MTNKAIYLDHAAATPLDKGVFSTMRKYLVDDFANAGSLHAAGQRAKAALEESRATVAHILNAHVKEIIFTNGGTESINYALLGAARAEQGGHIITSGIEHAAVLETIDQLKNEGHSVTVVLPDESGIISSQSIITALRPDTILVSLMMVNNEIGTIQPVAEVGRELYRLNRGRKKILFHTDASQATNYFDLNVEQLHVDMMSFSGGKIYGPKGTGVLYVRRGTPIDPVIYGGGQEFSLKSGTENIAGIVGLAAALKKSQQKKSTESRRLKQLQKYFFAMLQKNFPTVKIHGDLEQRSPAHIHISFPKYAGETLVMKLSTAGIYASTGSACSETQLEPSHVLKGIGCTDEEAAGSLRFSMGRSTTKIDINRVIATLKKLIT